MSSSQFSAQQGRISGAEIIATEWMKCKLGYPPSSSSEDMYQGWPHQTVCPSPNGLIMILNVVRNPPRYVSPHYLIQEWLHQNQQSNNWNEPFWQSNKGHFLRFRGDLSCILVFHFLQCFTGSCGGKRSWKLKRSKSAPTGAPLSHRKHCSWNASSVLQPFILWLCDITLLHRVTQFMPVYAAQVKLSGSWKHDRADTVSDRCLRRVRAEQSEQTGARF